jgi:chromosome segregation ATPase
MTEIERLKAQVASLEEELRDKQEDLQEKEAEMAELGVERDNLESELADREADLAAAPRGIPTQQVLRKMDEYLEWLTSPPPGFSKPTALAIQQVLREDLQRDLMASV